MGEKNSGRGLIELGQVGYVPAAAQRLDQQYRSVQSVAEDGSRGSFVRKRRRLRSDKRNQDRFPADFMFELSKEEYDALRSQFGTLKRGEHSKYLPYAFTEQGVAMLSSVLRSKRAVQVNIEIMRAFVRLRQILASNAQLARKLDTLEKKYDTQFKVVFDAIRQLMTPAEPNKRKIGFLVKERAARYVRG